MVGDPNWVGKTVLAEAGLDTAAMYGLCPPPDEPCVRGALRGVARNSGVLFGWRDATEQDGVRFDSGNGFRWVKEIEVIGMELGEPDASGRRSPVDTGETFVLEVDMVIKAAGQMPFEELVAGIGLENNNGKVVIQNSTTNIAGVFAGGDCVNGGKEVVDAVQAGKDGAGAILNFISRKDAK